MSILNPSCGAGILACDSNRLCAFLHETRFIDHENGIVSAQGLDNIVTNHIPQEVRIPPAAPQQSLHPPGPLQARLLSHHLSALGLLHSTRKWTAPPEILPKSPLVVNFSALADEGTDATALLYILDLHGLAIISVEELDRSRLSGTRFETLPNLRQKADNEEPLGRELALPEEASRAEPVPAVTLLLVNRPARATPLRRSPTRKPVGLLLLRRR